MFLTRSVLPEISGDALSDALQKTLHKTLYQTLQQMKKATSIAVAPWGSPVCCSCGLHDPRSSRHTIGVGICNSVFFIGALKIPRCVHAASYNSDARRKKGGAIIAANFVDDRGQHWLAPFSIVLGSNDVCTPVSHAVKSHCFAIRSSLCCRQVLLHNMGLVCSGLSACCSAISMAGCCMQCFSGCDGKGVTFVRQWCSDCWQLRYLSLCTQEALVGRLSRAGQEDGHHIADGEKSRYVFVWGGGGLSGDPTPATPSL